LRGRGDKTDLILECVSHLAQTVAVITYSFPSEVLLSISGATARLAMPVL